MIQISIPECIRMVNGMKLIGPDGGMIRGVSIDSRKEQKGRLFVPLKGERFDAHEFVPQAIENGATAVLWQLDRPLPDGVRKDVTYIGVDDTLIALQQLAKAYRQMLSVTIIGVTGSNGKTSTKDMIAAVLKENHTVQKTEGNLNNHIGVPLTLLQLEKTTQYAVVEMGMSDIGEIRLLAEIAAPQMGVITNIGEAHLEQLGSRERIAQAKFELIECLTAKDTAILQGDEPLLRSLATHSEASVIWFGFTDGNDVRATDVQANGLKGSMFRVKGTDMRFRLPVPGRHQVSNALSAIAIGRLIGLSDEQIATGLANVTLTGMRFEVQPGRFGGQVINDAYNASPTSMRAALHTLAGITEADLKVAVLGDMLELGPDAARLHWEVGRLAGELGIDRLLIIGNHAADMRDGALAGGMTSESILARDSAADVIPILEEWLKEADHPVVLVKASRGMKLETVARALI
ncbi:UDP-N-acetylmuramoyl-tripeptide--D-alanyl-D-alanine ligase [Collibacillus ludicampi]|uniref:UDP-N-acetylmuramoyl-tripeptide--D-alanyl-D-alanine ligase n=1 Tax=Collibacillus ludicampi TaxID=2771369 RepID=A0AAV4LI88_9BACL|nr:UDP-N-acetylmuramoyl-tripeptide--D-alanyl-D-alanine ligase [Collibacillus ludicampi]GIM47449.1 UDP-N-acetylmuramoyl-tripeptide--D-alanyl-D-alanine ligase [Collibacillus ludicampi]